MNQQYISTWLNEDQPITMQALVLSLNVFGIFCNYFQEILWTWFVGLACSNKSRSNCFDLSYRHCIVSMGSCFLPFGNFNGRCSWTARRSLRYFSINRPSERSGSKLICCRWRLPWCYCLSSNMIGQITVEASWAGASSLAPCVDLAGNRKMKGRNYREKVLLAECRKMKGRTHK